MMHRAWSSIVEVPFSFSRSYVNFQGHTALKIIEFDPSWAFPDSNSSLNSPMAMKCCTKLETAKERCPIVFQGHPSNFQGHTGQNFTDFDLNWAFPDYRPVAAFKSLRFALFSNNKQLFIQWHALENVVCNMWAILYRYLCMLYVLYHVWQLSITWETCYSKSLVYSAKYPLVDCYWPLCH